MNTLNHDSTSAVNPLTLKPKLLSTYLLIRDLAKRHGYCYAGNQALAGMLGVSVDTVTRRVKVLAGFGLLSVEQEPGLRRLLFVCRLRLKCVRFADTPYQSMIDAKKATDKPAPTEPPAPDPVSVVVCSHENTLKYPAPEMPQISPKQSISEERQSQNGINHAGAELAPELVKVGVSASAAAALVASNATECRRQLAEYRKRQQAGQVKGVGWLVTAIREGWKHEKATAKESYPIPVVERPVEAKTASAVPLDRQALAKGLGGYVRLRSGGALL